MIVTWTRLPIFVFGATAIVALGLSACSSIESRYIDTSGNTLKPGFTTAGVPVTVTVGDREGFLVTETAYDVAGQKTPLVVTQIDRNPINLGKQELFAVDMKRPVVGTASNTISLTSQYPTTIGTDVSDNTLPTVLSAVSSLLQSSSGDHGIIHADITPPPNAKVLYVNQYLIVVNTDTGEITKAAWPS